MANDDSDSEPGRDPEELLDTRLVDLFEDLKDYGTVVVRLGRNRALAIVESEEDVAWLIDALDARFGRAPAHSVKN